MEDQSSLPIEKKSLELPSGNYSFPTLRNDPRLHPFMDFLQQKSDSHQDLRASCPLTDSKVLSYSKDEVDN